MATSVSFNELISEYNGFKSFLPVLYARNGGEYLDATLNEMRAIIDHISLCYRDDITESQKLKELDKANGHLKRLFLDCFKQLNIIFHDYIADYESRYLSKHWFYIDGSSFWTKYTTNIIAIEHSVHDAKMMESIDVDIAFKHYQDAYAKQQEIYDLLDKYGNELKRAWYERALKKLNSFLGWLIGTLIITIAPTGVYAMYKYRSKISDYLSSVNWSTVIIIALLFVCLYFILTHLVEKHRVKLLRYLETNEVKYPKLKWLYERIYLFLQR